MPQRVVDLLDCWSCNFRRHHDIVIWRFILHYLMWCIWWERNSRSFEGRERSILEFKSFFFFTLLEWCFVLPFFSYFSLPVLIDHCALVSWCFCLFHTFLKYWAEFFLKFLCYLSKKKKIDSLFLYIITLFTTYPKQNGGWRLQRSASKVGWVDQVGRRRWRLEVREL